MQKKSKAKTIIIIVLAVVLVIESCVLIFGNKGGSEPEPVEQPRDADRGRQDPLESAWR